MTKKISTFEDTIPFLSLINLARDADEQREKIRALEKFAEQMMEGRDGTFLGEILKTFRELSDAVNYGHVNLELEIEQIEHRLRAEYAIPNDMAIDQFLNQAIIDAPAADHPNRVKPGTITTKLFIPSGT